MTAFFVTWRRAGEMEGRCGSGRTVNKKQSGGNVSQQNLLIKKVTVNSAAPMVRPTTQDRAFAKVPSIQSQAQDCPPQ